MDKLTPYQIFLQTCHNLVRQASRNYEEVLVSLDDYKAETGEVHPEANARLNTVGAVLNKRNVELNHAEAFTLQEIAKYNLLAPC